jgi:Family of unknown function (DUF6328)
VTLGGATPATTPSSGEGSDDHETSAKRNNRNLSDLLQELRVAGPGVQVLLGLLLSLPFTVRVAKLDPAQRHLSESRPARRPEPALVREALSGAR